MLWLSKMQLPKTFPLAENAGMYSKNNIEINKHDKLQK